MRNATFKHVFYFLWAAGVITLIAFSSCKKDEAEPDPVNLTELPGSALLGRGYDAFGDYANPKDVKTAMLDFANYRKVTVNGAQYKLPEKAEYQYLDEKAFTTFSGQSIETYLSKRMESAGLDAQQNYPFFKKAAVAYFDESEYRLDAYDFVGIESELRLWKVTLPYDAAQLRPLLSAEAKAELANMAPAALFEKYGTHLLTQIIIGGRAGYYTAADKSLAIGGMDLPAAAEWSFKAALGELNLATDPLKEQAVNTLREQSVFRLAHIGGDAQYGNKLLTAGNYKKWLASVYDAPALSGFTPLSLMPIWELCESAARRTQLLEAFETYAQQNRLPDKVSSDRACIAGITAMVSEVPKPPVAEGYRPICVNLNEGAGGKYVYFYYHTGLDIDREALTELTFVTGQEISAPFGWTKINVDLNAGTPGQHIYLSYKKALSNTPIRQLRILTGNNPEIPAGFTIVGNFYRNNAPQDLNEAAGGIRMWLAFSREPVFNP